MRSVVVEGEVLDGDGDGMRERKAREGKGIGGWEKMGGEGTGEEAGEMTMATGSVDTRFE